MSELHERPNQLAFYPNDYVALEYDQEGPLGLRFSKGADIYQDGNGFKLVRLPGARASELALYAGYYAHVSQRNVVLYTRVGACIANPRELLPSYELNPSTYLPSMGRIDTKSLDTHFSHTSTLGDRERVLRIAARFLVRYNNLQARELFHWDRRHGDYFME